jgi:serine/threonine protein kinase
MSKAAGCANVFDFYDFISELASGNQGVVYKAKQKKTDIKVAIKAIKKKNLNEEQIALQRIEIEAMKMCQHVNIMNLVDLFEDDRYFYLVLELLRGGDLFDYLERRHFKISEVRAKELFKQIADAVKYIH